MTRIGRLSIQVMEKVIEEPIAKPALWSVFILFRTDKQMPRLATTGRGRALENGLTPSMRALVYHHPKYPSWKLVNMLMTRSSIGWLARYLAHV